MRIILSFDVETDGPCVLSNNMIAFGVAAYAESGVLLDTLYSTIKPIEGHAPDVDTMERFWNKHPEQWAETQQNQVTPADFCNALNVFLQALLTQHPGASLLWVARPASFDWMWLKSYWEMFKSPGHMDIGYSAFCITSAYKQYIADHKMTKEQDNEFWESLTKDCTLSHNPVDDAIYQAHLYFGVQSSK